MKHHHSKSQPKRPRIVLGVVITTAILVFYKINIVNFSLFSLKRTPKSPPSYQSSLKKTISNLNCDLFNGEWFPNPFAPYYTGFSCGAIQEHQNCMKYGRPDSGFMQWRWKPDACDLPIFNPLHFLELMTDKSLAFVGDSLSRNQMQSLICLLSKVEYPRDVSYTSDTGFKRYRYRSYNFLMASFWAPHLVKANKGEGRNQDPNGPMHLYLDEYDTKWTTQIAEFDYVIISGGQWFFSPKIYHENQQIVGCHDCHLDNMKDLGVYYGYRKAFRTAFKAINSKETSNFKGTAILRTYSPSHFENGLWNEGGNCVRKGPFMRNEIKLEGLNLELHKIQMEEFRAAEEEGRKRGLKYRLLDTTMAMLLRPDGHPSRYGHLAKENVTLYNDCVHWCLPGPIDSWSDFLLEMLKREEIRSADEK